MKTWKKYHKKKFNYKKRKRNNRGMQRLRKSKWRINNPVGDTLNVKAMIAQRSTFSIADQVAGRNYLNIIAPDYVNNRIPRINDPYGLMGRFGSPLDDTGRSMNNTTTQSAAIFFRRYRVNGVAARVKITPLFKQTPTLTGVVSQSRQFIIAAWANPEPIGLGTSDSAPYNFTNVIPEQRWVKWRTIQQGYLYGGKPTTLKFYFGTKKVFGPDQTVKGDLDFTGITDSLHSSGFSVNFSNRPLIGPGLYIVVYPVDGLAMPTDMDFIVQINWTFYIKYFDKHQNTVAVTPLPYAGI